MTPADVLINGIRVILGVLLLMVIPGFLLTEIFYPRTGEIPVRERLVFSVVLSMGVVIAGILFADVVLGIDSTPENIVLVTSSGCIILSGIWLLRQTLSSLAIPEKISRISGRLGPILPPGQSLPGRISGAIRRLLKRNR